MDEQQREDATRTDARDAALRRFTLKYDEHVSGTETEAFKQGFTAGQQATIAKATPAGKDVTP